MQNLTPDGLRAVTEIADRNGIGLDGALTLLRALSAGQGHQAQFNHPDLGGMGQWSQGGMIMIGDMFNNDLKHRVSNACNDLAGVLRAQPFQPSQTQSQSGSVSLFAAGPGDGPGWPAELGSPTSSGAQNDLHYAYFADARRLAIRQAGRLRVYDTGAHRISGFSQAQGGGQTLSFTSQLGLVRLADLPEVAPAGDPPTPRPDPVAPTPQAAPAAVSPAPLAGDAIFAAIERLADLHKMGVLAEDEYVAKKRELLSRL